MCFTYSLYYGDIDKEIGGEHILCSTYGENGPKSRMVRYINGVKIKLCILELYNFMSL